MDRVDFRRAVDAEKDPKVQAQLIFYLNQQLLKKLPRDLLSTFMSTRTRSSGPDREASWKLVIAPRSTPSARRTD